MVVRRRHRLRIEIIGSRAERTHHKPVTLKHLMRGRRKVKSPHSGFEIVNVDCPRIVITIPSDDIKRVIREHHLRKAVRLFNNEPELTFFIMSLEILWASNVALRVWSGLRQLAEFVSVALRSTNITCAF